MTRIAVLLSVGRHPVSGRARRAPLDAAAVELALRQGGVIQLGLHAGPVDAGKPVLRDYLGMGLEEILVLDAPATADPLPALLAALSADIADVVLGGPVAETGESSGMTPYWLAERLGWPIVNNIVGLAVEDRRALLTQAMAGGRRRRLEVALPFVATVDRAAGAPRLSAFGPARRGLLTIRPAASVEPDERHAWPIRSARARPKRLLAPIRAGADRLGAILGGTAAAREGVSQTRLDLDPETAADTVLAFLRQEGLLGPAHPNSPPPQPAGDTPCS